MHGTLFSIFYTLYPTQKTAELTDPQENYLGEFCNRDYCTYCFQITYFNRRPTIKMAIADFFVNQIQK